MKIRLNLFLVNHLVIRKSFAKDRKVNNKITQQMSLFERWGWLNDGKRKDRFVEVNQQYFTVSFKPQIL